LSVAQLKEKKLWKAKQGFTHGLGSILTTYKITNSHSIIKYPSMLLQNNPNILLFNTSQLHFEKDFETQGF